MGDYTKHGNRAMNPWVLHLQKLGLELKCPLCLKFLSKPLLLPCEHIFCDSCVPKATQFDSECPICKCLHANSDLRYIPFMENIVSIYRNLDAAFSANLLQSQCVEDSMQKKRIDHSCTTQREGKSGEFEVFDKAEIKDESVHNLDFPRPSSQESNPSPKYRNLQVEKNQAEQLLPESPPSFGVAKGSDNDNSDHSPESYAGQVKRNSDGSPKKDTQGSSACETLENHLRDSKRQKKLVYGSADVDPYGYCNLDAPQRFAVVDPSSKPSATSDDSLANKIICGFCQSSTISEATGKMLHYSKGKQVEGDDVFCSNVIHVHGACIDWAPQVYYEGDSVKNLKAELARGTKIKCSKCGMKGAALGCYVKSCRRSYHVPCAQELPKCRWDYDDFLLLCPAHSSINFPSEKSGARSSNDQSSLAQTTSLQPSFPVDQPNGIKTMVLCGSALSSDEKFLLAKFASKFGALITKFWRPDVTHVIAATDENGACTRTLKVLMSILNGKWILNTDWIKASMEATNPVDAEPYEVSLDNHGCHHGPKTGRLSASDNAPKLFNGLKFYFSGNFVRGYKEDLQNLVKVGGGTILKTEDELTVQGCNEQTASSTTLVVYNIEPPQGCVLGEEVSVIWQRLSEAEDLAAKTGSRVVGHTWLLESIAGYTLQPLIS